MRPKTKDTLIQENIELHHQNHLRDEIIAAMVKGNIAYFGRGHFRLGICGETRAHGGAVIEMVRETTHEAWRVNGVYFWEKYIQEVRQYPVKYNDAEMQNRRNIAEDVAVYVVEQQRNYFQPKITERLENKG